MIDLQGAQNDSRYRGIGRYSLSLARAVIEQAGRHDVWIVFNSRFARSALELRAEFADLLPAYRMRAFSVPGPTTELAPENRWRTRAAEIIREHFLASLRPDVVHVSSLFEGLADDVVTSVGQTGLRIPTLVTLYDMIPFLDPDSYLGGEAGRSWYARKVASARRVDLLLGISKYSAEEGRRLLGVPEERVADIGTGVDAMFRPAPPDPARDERLRRLYGLDKPFLLYTGASDPRKNLEGLLQAAALLPEALRDSHMFALVGKFDAVQQEGLARHAVALGIPERSLRFLGYVPDRDLIALYGLCALFVFPSLHEGFGLPAAEAMACGAAVIGSNTSNIPEVIGHAEALFDPARPADIARRIEHVLTTPSLAAELRTHGLRRAASFSWQEVARRTLAGYEVVHERALAESRSQVAVPRRRLHLALVHFGTCDAVLRKDLSVHHDVVVFAGHAPADPRASGRHHDRTWLLGHGSEFDLLLYQLPGNEDRPAYRELAEAWPGLLLLPPTAAGAEAMQTVCRSQTLSELVEWAGRGQEPPPGALDEDDFRLTLGILARDAAQIDTVRQRYGLAAAGLTGLVPQGGPGAADAWASLIQDVSTRQCPFGPAFLDELLAVAPTPGPGDWALVAEAAAASQPRIGPPQLLVDVTTIAQIDAQSGIQRVVRSILLALIEKPPVGWRVEPVKATESGYSYARSFSSRFLDLRRDLLPPDCPVEIGAGDIFLGLDLAADQIGSREEWFERQRTRGMQTTFVVYDLLPVTWPEKFPDIMGPIFRSWIVSVARLADGVICISQAVAEEFAGWYARLKSDRKDAPHIGWFHLGADMQASQPSRGLPANASRILKALVGRPFLLSVGTLEPRKGYGQVIDAFERLWTRGIDAGLIIVGRPGWSTEALRARLDQHPERGRRLIWLHEASDEMLGKVYGAVVGLLAASEGEGFGLPLIEAAQHGLPILARDLPVFREVAGDHATYFSAPDAQALATSIQQWLAALARQEHHGSSNMPWLSWRQSASQLVDVVVDGHWQMPARQKDLQA
nr:glycosyltransferase family 1 protein [uncultured Lichenicoccus sp.]